jgi:DMSO/TMAO reductase YedYZ molybdopterin-dependent catalytic subunit
MAMPEGDPRFADSGQSWQEAIDAGLIAHSQDPLNCELVPEDLTGEVTDTRRFFRRNHFPMPRLNPSTYRLEVSGLVRKHLSVSLADLRRLPSASMTVTLECAGNGRDLFSPEVPGERWGLGAVSAARWTGARLRDVLAQAGVRPEARETIFHGADGGHVDGRAEPICFERSLPVRDAAEPGVLLAYEMNSEPLPVRHGFPVRLIVPGWYAVTAVKWLTGITLTADPFRGYFQDDHYVYEWEQRLRTEREPVRRQRVRAIIADPAEGRLVPPGDLLISGVAWSGEARVDRVEVSVRSSSGARPADVTGPAGGGWQRAELTGPETRFGWRGWRILARGVRAGRVTIRARAVDAAGNDQLVVPEWNRRGYGGNFVHEVSVRVR